MRLLMNVEERETTYHHRNNIEPRDTARGNEMNLRVADTIIWLFFRAADSSCVVVFGLVAVSAVIQVEVCRVWLFGLVVELKRQAKTRSVSSGGCGRSKAELSPCHNGPLAFAADEICFHGSCARCSRRRRGYR